MLMPNKSKNERLKVKKKTTLFLVGLLFSVTGLVAFSENTEWILNVEFKAKSEKQAELGQHASTNQGNIDKEVLQGVTNEG